MPRVGREVITPDGTGTVVELNILKETVRVRIPKGDGAEQKDFPLTDIQKIQPSPKPGRKDRPDFAPVQEEKLSGEDAAPDENALPEDGPDEESVMEFAGEEGISEDEALAEIEEISDPDESEDALMDIQDEDQ